MKLYQDRKLFKQLITLTSKELKIPLSIVEKDYHIMNILKELMAIDNSIVFKGGTSLSKCFKVINRFSEDLDLSYYNGNNNPTESMRKRLNKSIVDISSKYGYTITNLEDIKSRRAYNKFELSYSANFGIIEGVKSNLLVETDD
jgi:predicted nucleotidyltransferase component of viral defense system